MSLLSTLFPGWHRVLAAFHPDAHQMVLEDLGAAYGAEVCAVAQCTQHAHRMYYPQFRERLLRMAAETAAQIPWLKEQIRALGGTLPPHSGPPTMGSNSWECLRLELEEARRGCVNLLAWIHRAEQVEPEIARGLRRIRTAKQQHRTELGAMLMKSDPYTPPTTPLQPAPGEQPQRAWLEQRKGEWLDRERAAWEAGGKQVPWAAWVGEQEWRWAIELPHRDLEWARRLAEHGGEETRRTAGSATVEGPH